MNNILLSIKLLPPKLIGLHESVEPKFNGCFGEN